MFSSVINFFDSLPSLQPHLCIFIRFSFRYLFILSPHLVVKVDFDNLLMEQVVRAVRENPLVVAALVAVTLVCFVHPALGLFLLLLSHALSCHSALSRYYSKAIPVWLFVVIALLEGMNQNNWLDAHH